MDNPLLDFIEVRTAYQHGQLKYWYLCKFVESTGISHYNEYCVFSNVRTPL